MLRLDQIKLNPDQILPAFWTEILPFKLPHTRPGNCFFPALQVDFLVCKRYLMRQAILILLKTIKQALIPSGKNCITSTYL